MVLLTALRIDGCKGGEVVFADDCSRGVGHRVLIEGIGKMPDVAHDEGRADRSATDAIAIGLSPCRLARVEISGDLFHFENADGRREDIVKSFQKVFNWYGRSGRKRRDLCQGMDAGVSSPRSLWQDVFARETSNR